MITGGYGGGDTCPSGDGSKIKACEGKQYNDKCCIKYLW